MQNKCVYTMEFKVLRIKGERREGGGGNEITGLDIIWQELMFPF